MVMHQYKLECHAEKLVCHLQGQGHIEGLYDQHMTVFIVFFELLILLQLNLMVHYHKPECHLEKSGLLHSRSRSQWRYKISVNVYPDDLF